MTLRKFAQLRPMRSIPGIEIISKEYPQECIVRATLEDIFTYAKEKGLRHFMCSEKSPKDRLFRILLMNQNRVHFSANLDAIFESQEYGLFLKGGNPRDLKQYRNELLEYM